MAIVTASKCLWLLATLCTATADATCYAPPVGDETTGAAQAPQWTSCNSDAAESMCCRTETITGGLDETCMPNGLCRKNTDDPLSLWRESCTDPTWNSPACLRLPCNMNSNNNTEVTICPHDSTRFCCGSVNTTCCGTAAAFTIPPVNLQQSSTTATSATSTATSSTSSSASSSASSSVGSSASSSASSSANLSATSSGASSGAPSTSAPSSSAASPSASLSAESKSTSEGGLSTGTKAGIGVSVGVVVLAVLGLLGLWLLKRRPASTDGAANPLVSVYDPKGKNGALELHNNSAPQEVQGYRDTVYGELDERNYR